METISRQDWLYQLEQRLQERSPFDKRLRIRCGVRQGNLVVVCQHPPEIMPDPQETIEQLIEQVKREQDLIRWDLLKRSEDRRVMLVLRIVREAKPYRLHSLSLQLHEPQSHEPQLNSLPSKVTAPAGAGMTEGETAQPPAPRLSAGAIALVPPRSAQGQESEEANVALSKQWVESFLSDTQPSVEQNESAGSVIVPAWVRPWRSRLSSPAGILGVTALLAILAGGIYALTRPCVVGGCAPLQKAQQQSELALETIQQPQSAQQVVDAYGQVIEANYLLSTIPSWSSYYNMAQELMQSYEVKALVLEKVVNAQRSAYTAAVKSQNPPHPLPTWREVQQLWQVAIAELKRVPSDSPVHTLAQTKQAEYEQNLKMVNRFISTEQQAQERVRLAREAAGVAEARGGIANSLEAWRATQTSWKTAVDLLQQVSRNTMAYGEAQQLLSLYNPRLSAATTRFQQEEVANTSYTEALSLAGQAQKAERNNQWTMAVARWQTALNRVQQVPSGTSRYAQAQPLVTSYRNALNRAQQKLRTAVGVQEAQSLLEQTCGTAPPFCTFAAAGEAIQVRLTPSYTEAAGLAIATAPTAANPGQNAAMLAYMNPLLQQLASIGESANLPIELYNPDGSLFGTYMPNLDGYVPMRANNLSTPEPPRSTPNP